MNRLAHSLVAFALAGLALVMCPASPAQAQAPAVTIQFDNQTPLPIYIQGISVVGGTTLKGHAIFIPPGRSALDRNVPPGTRNYRIFDGNQPSRVLLPNFPVKVENRDLGFSIVVKGGRFFLVSILAP